jgi:outer membrane protein assembly factor BamB
MRRRIHARGWVVAGLAMGSLLSAAAIAAHATKAPDTSWPSFRNGNEQRGVAGSTLPADLRPSPLWKTTAGNADANAVQSTAAIVGDHVFLASLNGEAFRLDRGTGERQWTYKSLENPAPGEFLPGFKASPLVTDDTVYIGDEMGTFHAINRADGTKRWTFQAGEVDIVSCATTYKDKVLFGSHDEKLYCLNQSDGSLVWAFKTEGMVNCSPAVIEDFTFVTGCDGKLRTIDIRTGQQIHLLVLGTYIIASPAIVGDMLYVGTADGEVYAVDWRKNEIRWKFKDEQRTFRFHSSAAVTDEYVILGCQDKRLHCLDRQTGKIVWSFVTRGKVDSSPVVVGDRVFVGSDDGNLYGVTLREGKEVFRFTDGRPFAASPAIGEGVLVIGSTANAGNIYCFGSP